jgi:hypothetical protein
MRWLLLLPVLLVASQVEAATVQSCSQQTNFVCSSGGDEVWACTTIENLANADDNLPIWATFVAVTVQKGICVCHGTCTTEADVTFEDGAGNAMTGDITCEDVTTGDTPVSISAGGGLVANETMRMDTKATPVIDPETDEYTICWAFTLN